MDRTEPTSNLLTPPSEARIPVHVILTGRQQGLDGSLLTGPAGTLDRVLQVRPGTKRSTVYAWAVGEFKKMTGQDGLVVTEFFSVERDDLFGGAR
ncbi:hypothetical protein [Kitasatospora sp. NPDC086791]|uniref:hypothetical protein n=1 Tax=Kitasatospora sp. NPDC086791 TaxID=3155178 RepID=UPI0034459706